MVKDAKREGMTGAATKALGLFAEAASRAYGERLSALVVFGSRARGDASERSDLDVAVVLDGPPFVPFDEKMALADLAYEAIVETGIHVQPWPLSVAEWRGHVVHANPALVRAMRRDGKEYEFADVSRPVFQGA